MRTRIVFVVALALALALVPAAGGQAGKRTRTLDQTIHMAMIGENGSSGSVFAGEVVGRPTGRAALVARNTVTGNQSTGRFVVYAKKGLLRGTIENEIQPQPDGSVLTPGTFKITGGTGPYKGARGSGTFNGTLPAGSTVFEVDVDGKVRY